MLDEDISEIQRTKDGMLKYSDDGDLPNLYVDSIRNGSKNAVNEYGEFLRQLEDTAPEQVKGFEKAVYNKLGDHEKEKHFPEVFGKKNPLAQQASFRQGDGGNRRNADTPVHNRFLGQDDGSELRIKTAQNAPSGSGHGPATTQTKQPSPSMSVPAYRKYAKGLQRNHWPDWSNSIEKLGNLIAGVIFIAGVTGLLGIIDIPGLFS